MTTFPERMSRVIAAFRGVQGHAFNEAVASCRIDQTRCTAAEVLDDIRILAQEAAASQLGTVRLFGDISGEFDLGAAALGDVQNESLRFVFTKVPNPSWWYFLTIEGLATALAEPTLGTDAAFATRPRVIWMAATFDEFATRSLYFKGWGGVRVPGPSRAPMGQPRKLVRDLAPFKVPVDLSPWVLEDRPANASPVFDAWRAPAYRHLIFALPAEVTQQIGGAYEVALRGSRSVAARVDDPLPACSPEAFDLLTDAIRWIYLDPREAETKFTLLNYQLSLDWQVESRWPTHLFTILKRSLASAKDAFTFHLQDQSKELLKTLGDLRKALQDDVSKAQQSTRDVLTGLWRDFAIAGVVLALRTPSVVMPAEVLRVVTLATAALLTISLAVTLGGNARFNWLAARGRQVWRTKLYAFLTTNDWNQLVANPIRSSQIVYRVVMGVVAVVYLAIISYLVFVATHPVTPPPDPLNM